MIGSSLTKLSRRSSSSRGTSSTPPAISAFTETILGGGSSTGTHQSSFRSHRFLGTSRKNKKQALQRQRKLNPSSTLSSSTKPPASEPTEYGNEYLSSSSSSSSPFPSTPLSPPSTLSSRILSDPTISASTATFDRAAGLSKLKLRPSLDEYLEKYNLGDTYQNDPGGAGSIEWNSRSSGRSSSSSNGNGNTGAAAAPNWESNKLIVPSALGTSASASNSASSPSSMRLLRNSSTLASGPNRNNNNNTDNDGEGFLIDRDSMFDPSIHLPHAPKDWKGYEAATPLSDFLMQRIGVSGQPISTAEYMRHALTHPLYGYYTSKERQSGRNGDGNEHDDDDDDDGWDDDDYEHDSSTHTEPRGDHSSIFGRGGDFVTAPELSSVFGHSLCVWFMTIWQQEPLGRPSEIQFVELGPGRGTLMADLLELAHSSKLADFGRAIRTVHLVEASRELRREQKATLEKALGHLVRLEYVVDDNGDDGWEGAKNNKNDDTNSNSNDNDDNNDRNDDSFVNTIRVEWHNDFSSFQSKRDKSVPTMVLMQEFLDALPVHQFQKTEDGWRERMVDVVSADETNEAGQPVPTTPIHQNPGGGGDGDGEESDGKKQLIPRLRQVLAPNITPAVDLLLSSSYDQYAHFPEGTVVEICPDALFLIQDVAKVLEESEGAALVIDYGEEGTTDTLRAFSRHQQVPLTSRPGKVDVTADVDFFALKNCLSVDALKKNKSESKSEDPSGSTVTPTRDGTGAVPSSIHAFGPVPQGEFLMKMGAGELTMSAIEKEETTEEQAQAFADALKYLVMPEHMGQKFKVLALSRKRDGLFGPAGIE